MFANKDIVVKRPAMRPPNGTRPASSPHPSRGGNAYSPEVRFNMERNCFASCEKEDPPNVVTTEDSIISNCSSNASNIVEHWPEEIDDDVTLRNERVLAEWDELFDDDKE